MEDYSEGDVRFQTCSGIDALACLTAYLRNNQAAYLQYLLIRCALQSREQAGQVQLEKVTVLRRMSGRHVEPGQAARQ